MWRSGRHRKALNLIAHLPQASHYHAAVANDEEHVKAIIEATEGQPKKSYTPPLSEWTPLNEQIATLTDTVEGLLAVTTKANGGNPGKLKPQPRPATKFADVRQAMLENRHRKLVERLMRNRRRSDPIEP